MRRAVGYHRYDTPDQLLLLNGLYELLHLYTNFFLPVMKLKEKVQIGSRKRRIYDVPQTPYARTLASPDVSEADKAALQELYRNLDLVSLRTQIDDVQEMLYRTITKP